MIFINAKRNSDMKKEKSTEGTGECLAPMEDGRWLMSEG